MLGQSFLGGSPTCKIATVKKQSNTAKNKNKTAPLLQTPTDEDLSIVFCMFVCYGRDDGVIKHLPLRLDERTVCLHDDVILLTIIHDLSLLAEWMKLTPTKIFGISRSAGNTINCFTWIWFTAGASNPASAISLRWWMPLHRPSFDSSCVVLWV